MNIYKFNNLRINNFHAFFGWKISPRGREKDGEGGIEKGESREIDDSLAVDTIKSIRH